MKIKTTLCAFGVTTLVASVLAPVALAIDNTIDYAHSIGELEGAATSNILIQSAGDGGYYVTGVVYDRWGAESLPFSPIHRGEGMECGFRKMVVDEGSEPEILAGVIPNPLCGYVARYKDDGSLVWMKDLHASDYPGKDSSGVSVANVMPNKLKVIPSGVGLLTNNGDFFLLDQNTGNIIDSYLVNTISYSRSADSANINSDGSVSYYDYTDRHYHKFDDDTLSQLPFEGEVNNIIYSSKNAYYVDCDTSCHLYLTDEQFASSREVELPGIYRDGGPDFSLINLVASFGDLLVVTYSTGWTNLEYDDGVYEMPDFKVAVIKNGDIIASRVIENTFTSADEVDAYYNEHDWSKRPPVNEGDEAIYDFIINAHSGYWHRDMATGNRNYSLASDLVEDGDGNLVVLSSDGEKLSFLRFSADLALIQEVQLEVTSDTAVINDVAFLSDLSPLRVGYNTASSDYYDVVGNQNGIYVRYAPIILAGRVDDNPNTLDNIVYVVAGFGALLAGGFVVMKLRARR